MRTTVDLPPAVHRRARELADERGQSLSTVVAELTARGLHALDTPLAITVDPSTGLPSVSLGRRVTSDEVADLVDDA